MAIQSLIIIMAVLLVLLVLGVPISYAIGISSLAAILPTVPPDVSVLTAAQRTFVGMSNFSLTAIPFFVLAGNLMNQGGIAKRLVDFVLALLGKLPGSLLVTNIGANALFGAISGSASAAAAAWGPKGASGWVFKGGGGAAAWRRGEARRVQERHAGGAAWESSPEPVRGGARLGLGPVRSGGIFLTYSAKDKILEK